MRLTVLDYGSLTLALDMLTPGDGAGRSVTIGVPGYLIETDDGRSILVDTGLPHAYHADPLGARRADAYEGWIHRVDTSPEQTPAGQLALLGRARGDITDQVVTHTHFDHAGGMADFPDATMVIQRAERILPTPVYPGFTWPEQRRSEVIDGDHDLAPGVRLLMTPGHTPGHMSVLVTLPKTGPVILAIDALYLPAVLDHDNFRASWNEADARASGRRLARLANELGAWLIYGHDPDQWRSLRKTPEAYE